MGNTGVKVNATPCQLVILLTGDGTVAGPTLDNAGLQAMCVAGPLKDALNAAYANQAAMRAAAFGGPLRTSVVIRETPVDTTAERNQVQVDVDTDAVSPTKMEFNVSMSDTTGQVAYLYIEYIHSLVQ